MLYLTASDFHKYSVEMKDAIMAWLVSEGQDPNNISCVERISGPNEVPIYRVTFFDSLNGSRFYDDSQRDVATYRLLFEASKESPVETNGGTL